MVRCASSMSFMVFVVHEVKILMVYSQAVLLWNMWGLPPIKTGTASRTALQGFL